MRSILRDGQKVPRPGRASISIGAPLIPEGTDWNAAVKLRDPARAEILRGCGDRICRKSRKRHPRSPVVPSKGRSLTRVGVTFVFGWKIVPSVCVLNSAMRGSSLRNNSIIFCVKPQDYANISVPSVVPTGLINPGSQHLCAIGMRRARSVVLRASLVLDATSVDRPEPIEGCFVDVEGRILPSWGVGIAVVVSEKMQ